MKKLFFYMILLNLLNTPFADLTTQIQDKNGDVYILLRPKNIPASPDNTAGLYKFTRTQDYARSRLSLSKDSRINSYEGLSVDKFGHVKLFRSESFANKSVWDLLTVGAIYPGSPTCEKPLGKDNFDAVTSYIGGKATTITNLQAIKFGWVYMINTVSGDEGWFCLYPAGTHSRGYDISDPGVRPTQMIANRFERTAVKADSWLTDVYDHSRKVIGMATIPAGAQVFPPIRVMGDPRRHPNINGVGIRGQAWGQPVGFLAHGRGRFMIGTDKGTYTVGGGFAPGKGRRYGNASPMLGWFYARTPVITGQVANVRRIDDLTISRSKLFMEEYITADDNQVLVSAANDPVIMATYNLVAGSDYYTSSNCGGFTQTGFLHCSANPIDTAYAYSEKVESYNDCSDLCGQSPSTPIISSTVVNKGRAKFSSAGNNQDSQNAYIVKSFYATANSPQQTGVFKLGVADPILGWDSTDSFTYNGTGSFSETNGGGTVAVMGNDDFVIAYNFSAAEGGLGYASAIQTSKRITPTGDDTKDFIYVSDLPYSHFNVASSFWGTGGMVWWAIEVGKDLKLNYEQFNHFRSSTPIVKDKISVANSTPLAAFGADGDNFIYLLHSGGGNLVETEKDIDRLFPSKTIKRIKELCAEPNRINDSTCGSGPAFYPTKGHHRMTIRVNRFAGLKLEKMAPLPGAKPVKIGILPLKAPSGAECVAEFAWKGGVGATILDGDVGKIVTPWICSPQNITETIDTILDNYLIEMAVINVANPPPTSKLKIDIVEPSNIINTNSRYNEDVMYQFNMENPPVFNGQLAQLSLSTGSDLYGDVFSVSNYEEAGIAIIKNLLPSATVDLFYDDDGLMGTLAPSFIYKDLDPADPIISANGSKTIRYRWRVVAKTPPHSLKNYTNVASASVDASCPDLVVGGIAGAYFSSLSGTEKGELISSGLGLSNAEGVMFDSCWLDFNEPSSLTGLGSYLSTPSYPETNLSAILLGGQQVVVPATLNMKFDDPGIYEVQLYVGGLQYNADDLTFLNAPQSVAFQLSVTKTVSIINVQALAAQSGDEIKDVVIASNDLATSLNLRAGMYPSISKMESEFTNSSSLETAQGRFPVMPISYYEKGGQANVGGPLVVTYENQHMPMVAEAEIQFFRVQDLNYSAQENYGVSDIQTKFKGVGAWDFTYPGGGELKFSGHTFRPIDKRTSFPANYSSVKASQITTVIAELGESRRGYDASGDMETGKGWDTSIIPNVLLNTGNFEDAHQGTLASREKFPDITGFNKNLVEHPHSLYSWWEIKYAWFTRYVQADGTVVKKILKTGNLSEIFALNLMASKDSDWLNVVRNLAPNPLLAEGTSAFSDSSPLIKIVGSPNEQKFRVRIPLINPGALLAGSGNTELDAPLKNLDSNTNFDNLYANIHPMSINVPTEPGLVELGLQLFFPTMNWEGREESTNVNGNINAGEFSYYDAVYWGNQSELSNGVQFADFTKVSHSFGGGGNSFSSWPRFAQQRTSISFGGAKDLEAEKMGLILADIISGGDYNGIPGGFSSIGDTTTYHPPGGVGERDHFTEIVCLDLKNPILTLEKGLALNADTGGVSNEDIVLEVQDNNPFAQWKSFSEIGDNTLRERVPSLVNSYYEIGSDPRNLIGIGLRGNKTPERAYGFPLSFTNLNASGDIDRDDIKKMPQFTMGDDAKPITLSNLGYAYNPMDMEYSNADFYFPNKSSMSFPEDGLFIERKAATGASAFIGGTNGTGSVNSKSTDEQAWFHSWSRTSAGIINRHLFYPPANALAVTKDTVRTKNVGQTVDINMWMISHMIDNNVAPYNLEAKHSDNLFVSYLTANGTGDNDYEVSNTNCLSGESPFDETPDDCWIKTRWLIPKESLLAPYFVDSSASWNALNLNIYAKARDVRVSTDQPDYLSSSYNTIPPNWFNGVFGNWPSYDFDSPFRRRVAGENADLAGVLGAGVIGIKNKVERVLDNTLQRSATLISSLTVGDNDAPNVRVTLFDYKSSSMVSYAVMGAQGIDVNTQTDADDAFVFRSKDPRNTATLFDSDGFFDSTNWTSANQEDIRVNQSASSATNQKLYRIPEDVRFRVEVQASDNKVLENITISISGGHFTKFTHPDTNIERVETEEQFPGYNASNKRIYNQFRRGVKDHFYPRAGYYDVLEVVVIDGAAGNTRKIYIPIEVIPQDLHFRKLGSDQRLK
ncbi:MAG: hypothetical protein COB02_02585 [Candidatus Cloacimonadota bacterium]|nr:MAG: hypothetical protein COB02_02585 [Candidatus Cloacimonadota bacterium]